MTIFPIGPPPGFLLTPGGAPDLSATPSAATLFPGKVVRATVVEGPLLELGRERFIAVGAPSLRVGQTLELRILQAGPRLEALVLNESWRQAVTRESDNPVATMELLHVSSGRSADPASLVLPLPVPGSEPGDCPAGQGGEDSACPAADEADRSALQLSVSLHLSALGDMRIDLHYDAGQGLTLLLASEDRKTMEYVERCSDELTACLSAVRLRQVRFADNAHLPARRAEPPALPRHGSLLDTRA